MKEIKYIIIHCTATKQGQELTKAQIIKMHTSPPPNGRGWKVPGYSDMIHLDGSLENIVPYDNDKYIQPREITNGATGMNSQSRHIVYVGGIDSSGKPKDTRTEAQKLALANYIKQKIQYHPNILIAGHYDFSDKACPSFNVQDFCKEIGINESNIFYK